MVLCEEMDYVFQKYFSSVSKEGAGNTRYCTTASHMASLCQTDVAELMVVSQSTF